MDTKGTHYRYAITTYDIDDVFEKLGELGYPVMDEAPKVLYCDADGLCMFDRPSEHYLESIAALLNEQARQGRRLVQVWFRERQMIAVWEEEHKEA